MTFYEFEAKLEALELQAFVLVVVGLCCWLKEMLRCVEKKVFGLQVDYFGELILIVLELFEALIPEELDFSEDLTLEVLNYFEDLTLEVLRYFEGLTLELLT